MRVHFNTLLRVSPGIPCHPPPDIEHGSLKYVYENDFFYGSSVTYKCDRGYPLIGKESIYCTTHDGQSGEWSGPAPRCGGGVCLCMSVSLCVGCVCVSVPARTYAASAVSCSEMPGLEKPATVIILLRFCSGAPAIT